ncbi:class I SAM-dependent methyltransferase [Luteimonas sp. XNQY3]|nr:class I SAM-dependent methyltransferase [Luteimonas sp. XNQY3]MCD9005776.1 class I SAM-dependent methyltransferase [Luteimonas sp. XNQY3]
MDEMSIAGQTASDPAAERVAFEEIFNRAMMWTPGYRAPSAWTEHLPFAFWLMQTAAPSSLVELGSHYGSSYFGFCQAIQRLGLTTRCYAIDTWKGDEHAGFYGEDVFGQVRDHNAVFFSEFSSLVRATFDEALGHFEDGSIDVLHIDGMHTEEAVRHDVDSWLPKLSERGVLLMHDTNVHERDFGVYRVFAALREQYPSFEFLHGHGLGVVMVGPAQPEALRRLAALDDAATKLVREAFARLGRACAESVEGIEQAKRLRAYIDENDARGKRIEQKREELTRLMAEVASAHAERDAVGTRAQRAEKDAKARLERLGVREREIETQREELARLMAEVESAHAERDAADARAHRAEKDAKARLEQLGVREREIETLRGEVAACRVESEELRAESAVLSGKLDSAVEARRMTDAALEKMREDFAAAQRQFDSASRAAAEAKVEVEALQAKKQAAETALDRVLDSSRRLQEESERLSAALVDRYAELASLTKRLELGELGLRDSQARQRDLEARATAAEQGRDALRAELQALREDWMQVLGSNSWKLTRPLRGVRRLLSGRSAGTSSDPHDALVSEIRASGRFDDAWYLQQNPDVAACGWDALRHYVLFGAREGRDPSPDFKAAVYIARHPDAMTGLSNPLIHALRSGAA